MQMVFGILQGVPLWVYVVFVYGIVMGVRALHVRKVSLWELLIAPLVFFGMGLSSLLGVVAQAPLVGVFWTLTMVGGGGLGWFYLSSRPLSIDRPKRTLVVPGTWVVLILFFVVFTVKFLYGYQSSVHPDLASQSGFLLVVFGLSGISTGVMTARTVRLYNEFYQTLEPRTE